MELQLTQILEGIIKSQFTKQEVEQIIYALKYKRYILSATLAQRNTEETVEHFLMRFWDYDQSPYVKEKLIVGQQIHRRYVETNASRVKNYFIPRYGKMHVSEITKKDIKDFLYDMATRPQKVKSRRLDQQHNCQYITMQLKAETINQTVRAVVCAFKWAYHNNLTRHNCHEGILYCHVEPEKRVIPTTEQAKQIFSAPWKNQSHRLANMLAMFTGMRIGEVQALQLQDIGIDRIYVRHNWARKDGLKAPKNGDQRQIPIPPIISQMLQEQCKKNPHGQRPENYVFYSEYRDLPCGSRHWNEALHKVTKNLNIPNCEKITFHCWRHFYTTNMADNIDERKLQFATGHKTLQMLEHYAAHQREQTLQELGTVASSLFLPLIPES